MDDGSSSGQVLDAGFFDDPVLSSVVALDSGDAAVALCVHFWVIEMPNGPISTGTCRDCGEERQFRNSVTTSTWNRVTTEKDGSWT